MTVFIVCAMLWYVAGISSFIYWWTKEFSLDMTHLPLVFIVGIIGPVAFIIGWCFHGDTKVLIKRRK